MNLLVEPNGSIRCVYGENIDLHALGNVAIARGSHVEPDQYGRWFADLAPVDGPKLGPFDLRTAALDAEVAWLQAHWLAPTG